MALKALTVNDLFEMCAVERMRGNGKKTVVVASDEEGNSYNQIYIGFSDHRPTKELCQINSDKDIDTLILLQ